MMVKLFTYHEIEIKTYWVFYFYRNFNLNISNDAVPKPHAL